MNGLDIDGTPSSCPSHQKTKSLNTISAAIAPPSTTIRKSAALSPKPSVGEGVTGADTALAHPIRH